MDVLVGRFRYTATDDRKVFLLIAARCVGVDKSGFARLQIAVTDDAFFHFLRGHVDFPDDECGRLDCELTNALP